MTLEELKLKFEACRVAYLTLLNDGSANFDDLVCNYYHLFNYYKGCAETLSISGNNSDELLKLRSSINQILSDIPTDTQTDISKPTLVPEIFQDPNFAQDFIEVYIANGINLEPEFLTKVFQNALFAHRSRSIPLDESRWKFFDNLIAMGANIDDVIPSQIVKQERSSLATCIYESEIELAKYLVGKGANLELAKNQLRVTDLILYSALGDKAQVEECLKKSVADINAQTHWHETALNQAANANLPELVMLLLRYKADPNVGPSILNWATKNNYVDVVKALIKEGADPNVISLSGETPLMLAAKLGFTEVADALLKSPQISTRYRLKVGLTQDVEGQTAKEIANSKGHSQIVKLINECEARQALEAKKKAIAEAQKDLRKLIGELLVLNDGEHKSSRKYDALRKLKTRIDEKDFDSMQGLQNAAKNIVMLSLQHRNADLRHTTRTGRSLKELLNKEEYTSIRQLCAPPGSDKSKTPIKYRELRSLITQRNDPRFFSSRHKEKMYDLVEKMDEKLVDEKEISEYVSNLSKK